MGSYLSQLVTKEIIESSANLSLSFYFPLFFVRTNFHSAMLEVNRWYLRFKPSVVYHCEGANIINSQVE